MGIEHAILRALTGQPRTARRRPLPKTYSDDDRCNHCRKGESHSQREHTAEIKKAGD